ncbi:hypothetical protein N8152_02770 [bacterium]|nr:hypothetical protein [bacterium]
MSSSTDDSSASENLSELLALAEPEPTDEMIDGKVEVDSTDQNPQIKYDDSAHVAALAAIAERASSLPPYAGDDEETDAVFDDLLKLHGSIVESSNVEQSPWEYSKNASAFEARAVDEASALVRAISEIASDGVSDAVTASADAVKRRLQWSLQDIAIRRELNIKVNAKASEMRAGVLRHALAAANDDPTDEDVAAIEMAIENAAAGEYDDTSAFDDNDARNAYTAARGDTEAGGSGRGDGSYLDSPSSKSSASQNSSLDSLGSSLDDVIDAHFRDQRVGREHARQRVNDKVVDATREARKHTANKDDKDDETKYSADENNLENETPPPDAFSRSKHRRHKLRRRIIRDALVALPVLVFSLYDTARGERARRASTFRAERRRSTSSSPQTKKAFESVRDSPSKKNNSTRPVYPATTMKVGANSYEVKNGRVVTLATPAEERDIRKAFGMG